MNYFIKLLSMTCLFCIFQTQVSCYDKTSDDSIPNRNSHNSVVECNCNPNQIPKCCNGCNYIPYSGKTTSFFVQAAYTYWEPYQEGMDMLYAPGTQTEKGDVIAPKTYFRNGFKVGAGANNTESGWFWAINYTWFNNAASMKPNTLIPTLDYISPLANQAAVFSSLSSSFSNQFNRIDAFFDRDFYSGKKFTFRPWVGFLGAWERQTLQMSGQATQNTIDQPRVMRFRQTWWGVGPYGGMNCMYNFSQNFGLFIAPGVSLLYAHHNWDNEQYSLAQDDNPYHQHTNYGRKLYGVEPVVEISLGLNLSYMYDNFGIALTAAWEIQNYFSHNGIAGYYSPVGIMGSYSMQGLTFSARLSF